MPLIIFLMRSNLNVLIVSSFLLFVTPLMAWAATDNETNELLSGTHTARVIVPRAVVYSDEILNSPLGYIPNDKLITVGNPRKKNPDVLPLIVYGRLAFMETKNVHFENESIEQLNAKRGAPREHNIDIILEKPEEKLSENNSAYFDIHQFSGGEEVKALFQNVDGTEKESFIGYGLSLIHRQTPGRFIWGAGYEYNSISNDNLKFTYYLISPTFGYTPIKNSLFLVDLLFSIDFSIGANLKILNNSDNEPSAFVYGPQFNARMVFFPNQKYHLIGGIGYRSYKVLRVESLFNSLEQPINGISKIRGANLFIGLGLEI